MGSARLDAELRGGRVLSMSAGLPLRKKKGVQRVACVVQNDWRAEEMSRRAFSQPRRKSRSYGRSRR